MPAIRIVDGGHPDLEGLLRNRSIVRDEETERVVAEIISDVRNRGDQALLESARRFDSPFIDTIVVDKKEVVGARIPDQHLLALVKCRDRIIQFHRKQLDVLFHRKQLEMLSYYGFPPEDGRRWRIDEETNLGQRYLPIDAAGLYVPGGRASYPSSVLMLFGPAYAAGVGRAVVTTPARRDGTLDPSVLAAMQVIGVTEAYKIGGAAAIAALALGTETIARVDKIAGPGNRFVNEAKRQLWGQVGLDGYAGPSEVAVLADETANPVFAAADLITQVEHAPDNAGFLICPDRPTLDRILREVDRQLESAPRSETIRAALNDESLAIVARDMDQAVDLLNLIAPEHVTISVRDGQEVAERVRNAGCVLIGDWTPESVSDYCLGPSHTLPTAGSARFASPLNVLDFMKIQSVTSLTKEQLEPLAWIAETLAEIEGFPAHGFGASVRYPKRS